MLVVMSANATEREVRGVIEFIERLRLTAHPVTGPACITIGITGDTSALDPRQVELLPGVEQIIRITKPYKLASREMYPADTVISLPQASFGPTTFTIIAGPCSVENEELTLRTAEFLISRGVRLMRGGAYKPRTSPYSFQGLGKEGLDILVRTRHKTGIGIVTEVMDVDHVDFVEEAADIIQIGTRNMQNFSLLKRVSRSRKPVLLKRGLAATLEEWLMAAEYVMSGGNARVILCERGVRTFADHSRNTLDLSVIPPAKKACHLPIIVDPSHGTGNRDYVTPMALAGLAAGADGLLVEVHPDPPRALSDGAQSLDFGQFDLLLLKLTELAAVFGRKVN
jgi:3-deoxy-7-phosphoheptulonate synthase